MPKQDKLNMVEITKLLWAKFCIRNIILEIKETLFNQILEDTNLDIHSIDNPIYCTLLGFWMNTKSASVTHCSLKIDPPSQRGKFCRKQYIQLQSYILSCLLSLKSLQNSLRTAGKGHMTCCTPRKYVTQFLTLSSSHTEFLCYMNRPNSHTMIFSPFIP